jgi:hypothetical protein
LRKPEWSFSSFNSNVVLKLARLADSAIAGFGDPKASFVIVAVLLSLVLAAGIAGAALKPFWYDELFTVLVAQISPVSRISKALAECADSMPVTYYWLERLASTLPLDPHVAFRLPSILGYMAAFAALYAFTKRAFNPTTGLIAACLMVLSPFREYSIEARPYAIVTGSVAVAAAAWQRADEGRRYVMLLGVSLMLAVASHHYAIPVLSCFIAGETAWLAVRRRFRRGVWLAIGAATLPFWVNLPALLRFRAEAGPHFWSKPNWTSVPATYWLSGIAIGYWVALILVAMAISLVLFWKSLTKGPEPADSPRLSIPENVFIWSLFLFPVLLVTLAWAGGGGYVGRYGWPFIIAFAIICSLTIRALVNSRWLALVAFALAASLFARETFTLATTRSGDVYEKPSQTAHRLRATAVSLHPELPVVIPDSRDYLPIAYYAKPEDRARLVAVVDRESSLRYNNMDSNAIVMAALNRYVPLGLEGLSGFLAKNRSFYIWYPTGEPSWLPEYLLERGMSLRLVYVHEEEMIFLAESGQ